MEEPVRIDRCNNIGDFRSMARRRLPGPIFHYIDGAADDEVTYRRNTEAYERCDLVPNVLAGVESGLGDAKTGGLPLLWDQFGGCPETAQAASGMEAARSSIWL